MKVYGELADWFHLLTAPADYAEEARFYADLIRRALPGARGLLELGSGGGNNALHLRREFELVLVDLSPQMLEQSRRINPECEHRVGDMRSVRLGRSFDAVFIHDAVMYLLGEEDLRATFETAAAHLREGGVLVVAPDLVKETFSESTETGGHDGEGRSLRYLAWTHDPDPADSTCEVVFAILLRERDGSIRMEQDRHTIGCFPRETWLRMLRQSGFDAEIVPDSWGRENFLARRLGEAKPWAS
jgi:SAM-dependent methyltransferase